ncbi:MAG: hypothetical protein IJP87_00955, partial [Campylobacter sp.]|nr:hypothetical protein [Campylobacter sp.]
MWVNSKTAAAVLSIKFDTLRKKVLRASNDCKNFCVVGYQKLYFQKVGGRGGESGKVLQIWIDDSVIAEFESKNGVRVERDRIVSVGASGSAVGGAVANDGEFASVAKNAIVGSVGGRGVAKNGECVGGSLDCHEVAVATFRNDN